MDREPFALPRLPGWEIVYLESVDSTNTECARRAAAGAHGPLAVMAGAQTAGRGRNSRSFQSLAGKGLYLSVLFRPQAPPETLSTLTAWSAVAVCRAVEALTGLRPGIKWPNDVLLEDKKLCGILTELGTGPHGLPDHVVIGIGINVSQTPEDFGPELAPIAVSLGRYLSAPPRRDVLAAQVLKELDALRLAFPREREDYLSAYRRRCVTVGRPIRLLRPGASADAQALGINDDFSLQVLLPDGSQEAVSSGEASVRGLLGCSPP